MPKGFRAASAFVATLAFGAACTVHNPDAPAVAGPSVLALSLNVTATPDSIPMDGGSQSSVVVVARDPNGKAMSGVTLHLDISSGGTIQDFGALSAKTVVTGTDGKASAVYTAPPPPPPSAGGAGFRVSILVSTLGSNFQTTQAQSADIRLSVPGVVLPPGGAPTAVFSVTPTPVNLNVSATFDASASMPGTGASQITTYSWDFGDGSNGSGVRATHTYKSASTFTVVLVVVNDRGVQATTSQQVSVSPITAPTASFVFSPAAPVVGQAVVFNADASRAAPGHTLVQFSWIWGDGTPGDSNFVATHTFQTAGTYNVTLTVMDDTGLRTTANNSVIVGTGNPTATFTASNTSGHTMLFDASGTTAAVGATIAQYQWSFGDGTFGGPSTTPTITHTYGGAGAVTVRLTVTDSLGRTATFSLAVTVP